MTPEQKQIRIAELYGWHPHPNNDNYSGTYDDPKFWSFGGDKYGASSKLASMPAIYEERCTLPSLPNYLNSLDAMAEARKTLSEDEHLKYVLVSLNMLFGYVTYVIGASECYAIANMTASQHADAFLITKGVDIS